MQIPLVQRVGALELGVSGLLLQRTFVPKDGGIDPVSRAQGTVVRHYVREGTDPVVVDSLVCFQLAASVSATSVSDSDAGCEYGLTTNE